MVRQDLGPAAPALGVREARDRGGEPRSPLARSAGAASTMAPAPAPTVWATPSTPVATTDSPQAMASSIAIDMPSQRDGRHVEVRRLEDRGDVLAVAQERRPVGRGWLRSRARSGPSPTRTSRAVGTAARTAGHAASELILTLLSGEASDAHDDEVVGEAELGPQPVRARQGRALRSVTRRRCSATMRVRARPKRRSSRPRRSSSALTRT